MIHYLALALNFATIQPFEVGLIEEEFPIETVAEETGFLEPLSLAGEAIAEDEALGKEWTLNLSEGLSKPEELSIPQAEPEDLSRYCEVPAPQVIQVDTSADLTGPYEQLTCTVIDKQKISDILITMADNNVFALLFEKKRLERLGHDINHVHPIKFLGTVFSDPRLVNCMKRIRTSSFKWDGFIDGFSQRFREEIKSNNINAYLPGLSENLGVNQQDVQAYVNYKDFEGLVLYLMQKSKPHA